MSPPKNCPDCRAALSQIVLLDQRYGPPGELHYAKLREKKAILPTPSGTITGWLCPECNRVLLYAEPQSSTKSVV